MNWDRYNELVALRDSGRIEEATAEFDKLAEAETDPEIKAFTLLQVVNGLRFLKRSSDARRKIREASSILGPKHNDYIRVALAAAILEIDQENWKGALRKLDGIVEKYTPLLHLDENKDVLEEVQRNRGIALFELRRFREARPVLESVRRVPYERERTLCSLGMCNFELKDVEAAKRDFEELVSLQPRAVFRAYAYYHLGMIFYADGQLARAKTEFEKCLASTDLGKISKDNLLQWIVNACKGLNLKNEALHYSEMLKTLLR